MLRVLNTIILITLEGILFCQKIFPLWKLKFYFIWLRYRICYLSYFYDILYSLCVLCT